MPIDLHPQDARLTRAAGRLAATLLLLVAVITCGDPTGPRRSLPPLSELDVLADSVSFAIGDSAFLLVKATRTDGIGADHTAAEWVSRTPNVVSVDGSAVLHANAAGRSWVVARNGELTDSVLVVVRPKLPLTLSSHVDSLASIGDTLVLNATVDAGAPPRITWGSRDTNVVTVDQRGVAVTRGTGDAWVVALEDGGSLDSTHLFVRQDLARVEVTPREIARMRGRAQPFVATPRDARGTAIPGLSVEWSSTDTAVASVSAEGVATGSTEGTAEIHATIEGVTGSAVLTVGPLPSLRFNSDTFEVGVGQYPSGNFRPQPRVLADSLLPDEMLDVTLASSDPGIATIQPTTQLPENPGGTQGPVVRPLGVSPGVVRLIATADRFAPGEAVLLVTTPAVTLGSAFEVSLDSIQLDAGKEFALSIRAADSLGHEHHLEAPVTFRVHSSDPAVVEPADTSAVAPADADGVAVAVRGVNLGNARLHVTADGYRSDSILVTVVPANQLHFVHFFTTRVDRMSIGVGQLTDIAEYSVNMGFVPQSGDTVTLTHTGSSSSTPSVITSNPTFPGMRIPVTGVTFGRDTIIASARGFAPDTLVVDVGTPGFRLTHSGHAEGAYVFYPTLIFTDSLGNMRFPAAGPKKAVVTSTDPSVLRPMLDTNVIEVLDPPLGIAVQTYAPGTARLIVTDPDGIAAPFTSAEITVTPSPIQVSVGTLRDDPPPVTVGMHQRLPTDLQPYIYQGLNFTRHVTLTSRDPSIARPGVGELDTHTGLTFFDVVGGDRPGSTWIVASGVGLTTDSIQVIVGQPVARFVETGLEAPIGSAGGDGIRVELFDQTGAPRLAAEDVTFVIGSSNASVLTTLETTITVRAGAGKSDAATLKYIGEGTAAVRAVDTRALAWSYGTIASTLIEVNAFRQRVLSRMPVASAPLGGPDDPSPASPSP